MRRTAYSLLKNAIGDVIPEDRIKAVGTTDTQMARPFALYRFSGTLPGVTSRSASKPVRMEVWIHDEPGSYLFIDDTLRTVEDVMDAAVHLSAAEGESISQVKYESRSPDLTDDGFGTFCKMSNFTLIGKGQ